MVLDNNNCNDFNHPKEMNKILDMATTDFVVLMDDDVFVEEDWLDGLLKCVDAKTGVTMPMHKDKTGALSYSGVYLMGDDYGTHAHHIDVPDKPRVCQTLCSAQLQRQSLCCL